MEIQEKLMTYKYHIIFSLTISLILASLFFLAPRFLTILAYFWPLFLSTALFLVAVVFFGKTSLPATDSPGDKPGEDLLDYVVAGQPDVPVDSCKQQQHLDGDDDHGDDHDDDHDTDE